MNIGPSEHCSLIKQLRRTIKLFSVHIYVYLPTNEVMFSSLFVCLSVCWKDLHEIFREGWQWANEQMIKFWRRSGSGIWIRIRIRIRIAILARRALAKVCTVPVLLHCVSKNDPPLTCYLYIHGSIATIFGKNIAEKVSTLNVLYFPISPSPN